MALKPHANRTKLCSLAREDGLIVSNEDEKIVIDNGNLALFIDQNGAIADRAGKPYTCEEAFTALGVELR